jgi:GLPGLI family protein
MKKSLLILVSMFVGSVLTAQEGNNGFLLSGSVIYDQIVKLDIQLEDDAAQYADLMPKERKSEKILHFSEEAALFENYRTDDPEEALDEQQEGSVMIKMVEPDNRTFTDLKEGEQIEQKEFMSRMFLIKSELKHGHWKLTGEQKTILEYHCQQAITSEEDREVVAWFAPAIAVPAGPGSFGNLPGLVLEVNIDNDQQKIVATSVDLREVDKAILKKPSKGKEVTEEEYHAIVEEKMKEMGVEGEVGSGHAVVVKIRQ